MVARKLVSVITGTFNRHGMLLEMIENARAQTYRPLELVIVADGPDPELRELIAALPQGDFWSEHPPIIYQELGFWASGLLTDSISAAPFMVAQLLAQGAYQVWQADDERYLVPDAIEQLVDTLEENGLDWVYPQVEMRWPDHDRTAVIGTNPPRNGTFTNCLYKREMLDRGALFRTHVGSGTDWDCAQRMMASNTRWGFLRRVNLSHVVHK